MNKHIIKKGSMRFIYTFLFVAISLNGVAQSSLLRKAGLAQNKGDYAGAVSLYDQAISRGYELIDSDKEQLARLYYALGAYDQSRTYYQMIEEQDSLSATDLFNYSHALSVLGDKSGSDRVVASLKRLYPEDGRVSLLDNESVLRNVTLYDDFHVLVDSVGRIVQVIEQDGVAYGMRLGDRYDELVSLTDLSSADSLLFSEWDFNQGGIVFMGEDELLLTLNLNRKGKMVFDEDERSSLQLYKIVRDSSGNWSDPEYLSINVDGYNTANPALSVSGDYLYFASDRPGGYGQSDIYRVAVDQEGNFGAVENLGDQVNTAGRESHVFIDEEGLLYFSSDGYPGKGGMDVYGVDLSSEEVQVFNIGSPINTVYNDYAYSRYGTRGYVSTDRAGYLATWAYDLQAPIELTDQVDAQIDLGLANAVSFEKPIKLKVIDTQSGALVWEASLDRLTSDKIKVEGLTYGKSYRFEAAGMDQISLTPKEFVATNSPVKANVLSATTDVISSSVRLDLSATTPLEGGVEVIVKDQDGAVVYSDSFSKQPGSLTIPNVLYGSAYTVLVKGSSARVITGQLQVNGVSEAQGLGLSNALVLNSDASLTDQAGLAPLLFDFDRASLKLSQQEIEAYLSLLSQAKTVRLEGYTDRQGDSVYNLGLAERRVAFIAELFKEAGLQVALTTQAKGEENPVVDCGEDGMSCSIETRRKNRRVEVFVEF